uniref:Large ribosomal subunit protein bL32m n=1 Tax=Trichuris muris TaxID=70415 RepID=A0A5S6QNG8_TRIMR
MNWLRLTGMLERMIASSFDSLSWDFLPMLSSNTCGGEADPRALFSWNVLWGVPVHKTSRPRKKTRMFSQFRLLKRHKNLIPCPKCGDLHQLHTICGTCYASVRERTNEMRQALHNFDETYYSNGQPENQSKNKQDDFTKPTVVTEKRPCRSGWYSKHLKDTWHRTFDSRSVWLNDF